MRNTYKNISLQGKVLPPTAPGLYPATGNLTHFSEHSLRDKYCVCYSKINNPNFLTENKIIEGKGSHPIAIELGRMADSVAAQNEKLSIKEKYLVLQGKIQLKEKQSHKSFFEPKI